MRRLVFIVPLLLTLGCRMDPRQRIVGNWIVDQKKTVIPPTPMPGAEERVKKVLATVSVKFSTDGTAIFSGPVPIEGTWTYTEGTVKLVPKDKALLSRLPLGIQDISFTVDEEFKNLSWKPQTPFGEIVLVMIKTG
ncbi:MAG TPA: lipocalin family protein [Fimbriimonas sp.]